MANAMMMGRMGVRAAASTSSRRAALALASVVVPPSPVPAAGRHHCYSSHFHPTSSCSCPSSSSCSRCSLLLRRTTTTHAARGRCISTSTRCLAEEEEAASEPAPAKDYDPKLVGIVDEIAKLTLLEVADLTELMKDKLNIIDAPMMGMPMGGMPVGGAAAAPAEDEPKEEQTEFNVKLEKFDAKSKVKIIKEIKGTMDGMNLVQAKKFVEGAPGVIKEAVSKAEAEELKKKFEELGATIVLE